MARLNFAADFRESSRSTRLLASAHSCAQRLQLSLEGLGGVSNLLALTGVGTGLVISCLTGMMIDRSLGFASNEGMRQTNSGFAGSTSHAVDL